MPETRSAPVTVPAVRAAKVRDGHAPLVMVTAYDAPGARVAEAAGVDMILVGDSLGNVVLGYEDTLQVTVDDMVHHVAAVARTRPGALVIGDLPWMSYHVDVADTVRNAARLIRAGATCVKLEGGAVRAPMVEALVRAEIPVMGHLGLTPQSVNALGGFRVQARDDEVWRVRAFGDFLSYCFVAEGAVDIAAEPEVSVWDLAPLDILVREAGGTFTDLDGTAGPHGGNALATNGLLHDQVLERLSAG